MEVRIHLSNHQNIPITHYQGQLTPMISPPSTFLNPYRNTTIYHWGHFSERPTSQVPDHPQGSRLGRFVLITSLSLPIHCKRKPVAVQTSTPLMQSISSVTVTQGRQVVLQQSSKHNIGRLLVLSSTSSFVNSLSISRSV
jgi:hypothetical protein